MVDRYTKPGMSVWAFEINIGIRFTNGSGPLCVLSARFIIFTYLTLRYFTFFSSCKLGRSELMSTAKHMLDGLHVTVTKIVVPQEKNILGRSQTFIYVGENWQNGFWSENLTYKESISHLSPIVKVPVAHTGAIKSCWYIIKELWALGKW